VCYVKGPGREAEVVSRGLRKADWDLGIRTVGDGKTVFKLNHHTSRSVSSIRANTSRTASF
jgi:hypothetical protein